jgi:hypothetical protein
MTPFVVGITGKRGHGKTTAAQGLERAGFRHINFADPLREVVNLVYGVPFDLMLDPVLKEEKLDIYPFMSPRELLQKVGTELFREGIHKDTWIEAFGRRAAQFSHVVCSDCRFPNEADAIRSMKGMIIKVINPNLERGDEASQHPSETGVDLIVADWSVENNPRTNTPLQLQRTICDIVGVDFAR